MITAHIIGASGYAAAELIRLIDRHPSVALGVLSALLIVAQTVLILGVVALLEQSK